MMLSSGIDYEELRLKINDAQWLMAYDRLCDREEKATWAALASGRTLDEARAVAKEMYADKKAHVMEGVNDSCKKLSDYRASKRAAQAVRPWWRFWP